MDNVTPIKRRSFAIKNLRSNLYVPLAVIVIIIIILGLLALRKTSQSNSGVAKSSNGQVEVQKAKAAKTLSKTYTFPLKDDAGKDVSTISYTLESVELRDQIIVKGETATAVKGRTFAIVNLKLTNNYTKAVSINARDYVRLIIKGSTEKLAADIHNDPVEVQAISTKYTRIGFPIDDTDKKFTLQIGEITGPKKDIQISF